MPRSRSRQAGFALILAIMALLLLTFLALALATSSSTELQIATNYRWSQQALYNAEAGVDAARLMLRNADWTTILYGARTTPWLSTDTLTGMTDPDPELPLEPGGSITCGALGTATDPCRDYTAWQCDRNGHGAGYGATLRQGGVVYANITTWEGQSVNGAFTIWVRRPLLQLDTTQDADDALMASNPTQFPLIVTVEGVAPYRSPTVSDTNMQTLTQFNQARRYIEQHVTRTPEDTDACGTRGGQAGGGPEGANFSGCTAITGAGVIAGVGASSGIATAEDTGAQ